MYVNYGYINEWLGERKIMLELCFSKLFRNYAEIYKKNMI